MALIIRSVASFAPRMSEVASSKDLLTKRQWAILAGSLFAAAVLLGAGPGMLLVKPAEGADRSAYFIFGMPKLYVWAIGWFFVEVIALVICYLKVWKS